eukprot:scaffold104313_cov16-Prasinocladus_malaysianus.AAC.1
MQIQQNAIQIAISKRVCCSQPFTRVCFRGSAVVRGGAAGWVVAVVSHLDEDEGCAFVPPADAEGALRVHISHVDPSLR